MAPAVASRIVCQLLATLQVDVVHKRGEIYALRTGCSCNNVSEQSLPAGTCGRTGDQEVPPAEYPNRRYHQRSARVVWARGSARDDDEQGETLSIPDATSGLSPIPPDAGAVTAADRDEFSKREINFAFERRAHAVEFSSVSNDAGVPSSP